MMVNETYKRIIASLSSSYLAHEFDTEVIQSLKYDSNGVLLQDQLQRYSYFLWSLACSDQSPAFQDGWRRSVYYDEDEGTWPFAIIFWLMRGGQTQLITEYIKKSKNAYVKEF